MGDNQQIKDVRCNDNPYNTLLYRYGPRGIYVYCRDCRDDEGKRGQEHLITWDRLLRQFLGMDDDE